MDEGQDCKNYRSYRFKDNNLAKCNMLLEKQVIKMWLCEAECLSCLKDCADQLKSGYLASVIEQFLYEGGLQVKRLRKVGEVLKMDMNTVKLIADEEVTCFLESVRRAIAEFSGDDLSKRWTLILALEKLIHYKMASYQSMVSWAKSLRLYGVQELLEDSLDEYVHQDLLLDLISETWCA